MIYKLQVPRDILAQSITLLKGSPDAERVILWLGKMGDDSYFAQEVFMPIQMTEERMFHIPLEGMRELFKKLRDSRLQMVAQLHTHPEEAFHSAADNRWAILRHVNAYSIVLPNFCSDTDLSNFLQNVATYILTVKNKWIEIDNHNIIVV